MQHLPAEAAALLAEAAANRRRCRARRAAVRARSDAGVALSRQSDRQPGAVVVRRRPAARHAVRLPRLSRRRAATAAADGARLRDRNRDAGEGSAAWRSPRCRAGDRGLRRTTQQAAAGAATRRAPVFWRCTIGSSNASEASGGPAPASAPDRRDDIPRRWTLHGLNNGTIFSATYRGVGVLPPQISYAIGRVGTWLAWRLMRETRTAIADNLRALSPDESDAALERRARVTLRRLRQRRDRLHPRASPIRRRCDRRSSITRPPTRSSSSIWSGRAAVSSSSPATTATGRSAASFCIASSSVPLAIVAMAEADPAVNRLRREIRDLLGADTIEVGHSLDTALQIRRRLADEQHRGDADGPAPRPRPRERPVSRPARVVPAGRRR